MKRMYVVLTVILLLVFGATLGLAQKSAPDMRARRMQLRAEMHRKMLNNLMHGTHDEDLFRDMDKLMEEAMQESGFSYSFGAQNFETEWSESAQGRTLLITPQSKDQKLDINVASEMVTIKGKSENKTPSGTTVSDFQNSFSIPQDCDSAKVKMDQKDGKIVMFFPWRSVKKISPKKDERIPLPKSDADVAI